MARSILGIIGGGQLGSMLSAAAKKIDIKTVVYCDDMNAPAQNFANEFIYGRYDDEKKINEFASKVDVVTFEFENIPYETLYKISQSKIVLPKPKVNKIVQNRLFEKDFVNKINIRTTLYVAVKNDKDLKSNVKLLPGILKTCNLGYDGKGQFKINSTEDLNNLVNCLKDITLIIVDEIKKLPDSIIEAIDYVKPGFINVKIKLSL